MPEVVSFDVFDTALVRTVAVPSDVFFLLGARIATQIGAASPHEYIADFVSARLEAERRALTHGPREECTLHEIWTILHSILRTVPREFGPNDEMEIERSLLYSNPRVALQISQKRQSGTKIIFISDTYLPEVFVRDELIRRHLALETDSLYVSSSIGLTKRSGNLFNYVLVKEDLRSSELEHFGDNIWSDVKIPAELGIRTTRHCATDLTRWEQALAKCRISTIAASQLSASMRRARLADSKPSDPDGIAAMVSSFLGPAIFLWSAWVLGAARKNGIRRLYFAARDGYLASRAAKILAPQFGDIECRYAMLSRQAVLLPSVKEVSPRGIPWLHRNWEQPELRRLLPKLGLNRPEVAAFFAPLTKGLGPLAKISTPSEWAEFWRIVQSSPVRDEIDKTIVERRKLAFGYLVAQGFTEPVPSAIVDIGWHATVQTALHSLLVGGATSMSGYYLGLASDRAPSVESGPTHALFYGDPPDRWSLSGGYEMFRRVDVMEHVLGLAPHGSVRGYRLMGSNISPECSDVNSRHVEMVENLATAVEQFCIEQTDAPRYAEEGVARELLDSLITEWCRNPNREALKTLVDVSVSDDQNNIGSRPLVDPWRASDLLLSFVPGGWRQAAGISIPSKNWPEAALLSSGGGVTALLRARSLLARSVNLLRLPRNSD